MESGPGDAASEVRLTFVTERLHRPEQQTIEPTQIIGLGLHLDHASYAPVL